MENGSYLGNVHAVILEFGDDRSGCLDFVLKGFLNSSTENGQLPHQWIVDMPTVICWQLEFTMLPIHTLIYPTICGVAISRNVAY